MIEERIRNNNVKIKRDICKLSKYLTVESRSQTETFRFSKGACFPGEEE